MTRQFHQVGLAAREAARLPLRDGDPGRVGRYWLIARLGSAAWAWFTSRTAGNQASYCHPVPDRPWACPAGSRVELRMSGLGV